MSEGTDRGGAGSSPRAGSEDPGPAGTPRLRPGGRVAGGRYRLVECHGGAPGQSFWRAHDERLDRDVALTFVDPLPGETPPGSAAAVLDRTLRLTRVYSPGLARILDVVRGRVGGIVVAEWVPGRSLAELAATPEPGRAAGAGRGLAQAAARAEESDLVLGIDRPDRIRVTPDGHAVLAFPAVAADADSAGDVRGLGAVLYCLLTGHWPHEETGPEGAIPEPAAGRPATAGRGPGGEPVDAQSFSADIPAGPAAVAMRALDGSGVSSAATVHTLLAGEGDGVRTPTAPATPEAAAAPAATATGSPAVHRDSGPPDHEPAWTTTEDDSGDHRSQDSRRWMVMAGVGALSVVVIAALLAWMLGLVGGSSDSTPLAQQLDQIEREARASRSDQNAASESSSPASAPGEATGPALTASSASSWQPASSPGSAENPGTAGNAVDGDSSTSWSTESYLDQFGTKPPAYKPGLGLLVTLGEAAKPRRVVISSPDAGVTVEIRTATTAQPTALQQTTLIGSGTLTSGKTTIELTPGDPAQYVMVWITTLHADGPKSYRATLTDVVFSR